MVTKQSSSAVQVSFLNLIVYKLFKIMLLWELFMWKSRKTFLEGICDLDEKYVNYLDEQVKSTMEYQKVLCHQVFYWKLFNQNNKDEKLLHWCLERTLNELEKLLDWNWCMHSYGNMRLCKNRKYLKYH